MQACQRWTSSSSLALSSFAFFSATSFIFSIYNIGNKQKSTGLTQTRGGSTNAKWLAWEAFCILPSIQYGRNCLQPDVVELRAWVAEISLMVCLCQKHLTHTKGSVSRKKFTTGENYLSLGNQLCNFSGPPLICLPVSFFITLMLLQMQREAAEFSD